MKVLLISPPYQSIFKKSADIVAEAAPWGLAYIASYLRERGINVDIIDAQALGYDEKTLRVKIIKFDPDIVGITSSTPVFPFVQEIASVTKDINEKIKVVVGGHHPSALPKEVLNDKNIDIAVIGEGEVTMYELVKCLENNEKLKDVKGIMFKDGKKKVFTGSRALIEDIDSLPFPARDLLPMQLYKSFYVKRKPFDSIIGSRGCPFGCVFCSKAVHGRIIRFRSPENIIKEVDFLIKEYDIKDINFLDDTIAINKERLLKFCSLIKERGIDITWKCQARVTDMDKEKLEAMKNAGCYFIGYGVESGNENILRIINKGITLDAARKAVKLTKEVGIEAICSNFIIGHPGDTKKTIEDTINFAIELDTDFIFLATMIPYPGTQLYEMVKKQGKFLADYKDFLQMEGKAVFELNGLTKEIIEEGYKKAARKIFLRPKYVTHSMLKILSSENKIDEIKMYLSGLNFVRKIVKE